MSGYNPGWVVFSFPLIETISITGQNFPSVLQMAATVYERDNWGAESPFYSGHVFSLLAGL